MTHVWGASAVVETARQLSERTGGPNTAALEPPSSSETTVLPDELAASPPGRCYRVASVHRRVTHRAEGGSQPEGPGSSPSRRHALITACFKRPLKSSLPDVTEVSSTGTFDPVCGIEFACACGAAARSPRFRSVSRRPAAVIGRPYRAISRRRGAPMLERTKPLPKSARLRVSVSPASSGAGRS